MKAAKVTQMVAGIWHLVLVMPVWFLLLFLILYSIPTTGFLGWLVYALYILVSLVGLVISIAAGLLFGDD